jgi:serine/threonine protein kinase
MIYESFKPAGEGPTGKVYRAFDRLMSRPVAVKRIRTGKLPAKTIEEVLEQTHALRRLIHPNLAVIYDVYRDDDVFIATEWFEGENLEELFRHGKMLVEQFVPFALQIQEGMIAAHALGILHRGIKPANIMMQWLPSGSMHVKIIDFGVSRLASTNDRDGQQAADTRFMSPEQMSEQPLDVRSDLYSLGCLYYFSLTQRHPFEGEDSPGKADARGYHRITPLQEIRPDLPSWLCAWIMWHLERQPEDRPESATTAFHNFKHQMSHTEAEPDSKQSVQSVAASERYRTLRPKAHAHTALPIKNDAPDQSAGSRVTLTVPPTVRHDRRPISVRDGK